MAPDFLPYPPGAPKWRSAKEGFSVPKADPVLPAVHLLRRVEASGDFADLVRITRSFPSGIDFLCALVRRVDRGNSASEGLRVQGLAPTANVLRTGTVVHAH